MKKQTPKTSLSSLPLINQAKLNPNLSQSTFAIGDADFKSIIEQNKLLIDKSLFIKEIIDDGGKVKLILRPRRFGKTLNMSMLKYFFERTDKKHDSLFHNTAIWKAGEHYQREQGQYPVLFITLKDIKANQFTEAEEGIRYLISNQYKHYKKRLFSGILREEEDEQRDYQQIIDRNASITLTSDALRKLTEYLHKEYSKPVIVLIDEYDTPLQASYTSQPQYHSQMIKLMRDLLCPLLKDNSHLHQAVLTGILRIAKESIFSGLNNLRVYSVLSGAYQASFGFSVEEIKNVLGSFATETIINMLEDWYGGYQIGGQARVFNPWSVVNFIQDNYNSLEKPRFDTPWIHSSENKIIEELLQKAGEQTKKVFCTLLENKPIAQVINEHTVFSDIEKDTQSLWSFLLLSGYLTTSPDITVDEMSKEEVICYLVIPNKELYGFYEAWARKLFKEERSEFVFKNRVKIVTDLEKIVETSVVSDYKKRFVETDDVGEKLLFALTLITESYVDDAIIGFLIECRKEIKPWIWNSARKALVNASIAKYLKTRGEDQMILSEALHKILLEALSDGDSGIRQKAAEALMQIGKNNETVQVLLKKLEGFQQKVAKISEEAVETANQILITVLNAHKDKKQLWPIESAEGEVQQESSYLSSEEKLPYDKVLRWLLENRDSLTKRDNSGGSVLLEAATKGRLDVINWLLKKKVTSIDEEPDNYGNTVLLKAAYNGHLSVVQWVLKKSGASIKEANHHRYTALLRAAYNGHLPVVQWLLKEGGASIKEVNEYGNTALLLAAMNNHLPVVQWLLKEGGASIKEASTESGDTALLYAANNGHLLMVQWLLEDGGASIKEASQRNGNTALLWAAWKGHLSVIQWLLEGAWTSVREMNKCNDTALLYAAWNGHEETVKWLLNKGGASIKEKNEIGCTALLLAAMNNHLSLVQWLVKNGASVKERDNNGTTALLYAALNGHLSMVEWLLKEGGSSIEDSDTEGNTALLKAIRNGNQAFAYWLLTKGRAGFYGKDNLTDFYLAALEGNYSSFQATIPSQPLTFGGRRHPGNIALLLAASAGHFYIVEDLLNRIEIQKERTQTLRMAFLLAASNGRLSVMEALMVRADKSLLVAKDIYHYTPLLVAARNGHLETVRWLVIQGASLDAKTKFGDNALKLAEDRNHTEVVAFFKSLTNSDQYIGQFTEIESTSDANNQTTNFHVHILENAHFEEGSQSELRDFNLSFPLSQSPPHSLKPGSANPFEKKNNIEENKGLLKNNYKDNINFNNDNQAISALKQKLRGVKIMPTILNIEDLKKQKKIFEDMLVRETLAEIQFIWDQVAERAQHRPGFGEKLLAIFSKALTALLNLASAGTAIPFPIASAALAGVTTAVDLTATVATTSIGNKQDGKNEKAINVSFIQSAHFLQVALQQFAKVASLRYEYLIAVVLSENPAESVIPLARIGARRLVEYLERVADHSFDNHEEIKNLDLNNLNKDNHSSFPLFDFLLDGLIQGHSGQFVDGFSNNKLVARDKNCIDHLTVEGALGRPAMRVLDVASPEKAVKGFILYREKSWHKEKKKDKHFNWGKTSFHEKRGRLRNKGDSNLGPKYGFIFVDGKTAIRYDYKIMFSETINNDPIYDYQPSIFFATKTDVMDYVKYAKELKARFEQIPNFLTYIQKLKKLSNISTVWVRANFDGETFDAGDFSRIDFAGCSFNEAKFESVDFTEANLAFISAVKLRCQSTKLNQADLSFAVLNGSTFMSTLYIDANWVGAQLEGIEDILAQEITARQKKQEDAASEMRVKLEKIHVDLKKLERRQAKQIKKLEILEEKLDENGKELIEQAKQYAQILVNIAGLESLYSIKNQELETRMSQLDKTQVEFTKNYQTEIASLNGKIKEIHNSLLTQLQKGVEEVHQKFTLRMSLLEGAKLDPNSFFTAKNIHTNLVNVPAFLIKSLSSEDQSQLVKSILTWVETQKDAINVCIGKGLIQSTQSKVELDTIITQLIRLEDEKDSNNNAPSKPILKEPIVEKVKKPAPMTISQTNKFKYAQRLLDKDYPKDSNNSDLEEFRQENQALLDRLKGHRLTTTEEGELDELIRELGGNLQAAIQPSATQTFFGSMEKATNQSSSPQPQTGQIPEDSKSLQPGS